MKEYTCRICGNKDKNKKLIDLCCKKQLSYIDIEGNMVHYGLVSKYNDLIEVAKSIKGFKEIIH